MVYRCLSVGMCVLACVSVCRRKCVSVCVCVCVCARAYECQARELEFSSTGSGNLEDMHREVTTCPGLGFGEMCDTRLRRTLRAIAKGLKDTHVVRA